MVLKITMSGEPRHVSVVGQSGGQCDMDPSHLNLETETGPPRNQEKTSSATEL